MEEKNKKSTKKVATKKADVKATEKAPAKKVAEKAPAKKVTTAKAPAKTKSATKTAVAKKSNNKKVAAKKADAKKVTAKNKSTKTNSKAPAKKQTVKETAVKKPSTKTTKATDKNKKVVKEENVKKPTAKKEGLKAENKKNVKKATKNNKKTEKTAQKVEKNVEKDKNVAKILKIEGYNALQLYTAVYDKVENPKAVVLIVHGMQEHCGRYENFAKFLNSNGYIVITSDLRGHGHTMKSKEEYGMGEEDIFKECLQDQLKLIDFAASYKLPIYIFGHSYGSMLTQNLIQMSPLIEKAVLCGTTNGGCGQFKMASCLVSVMSPFKNHDKRGGLAEKLCIKSYGKKFKNGNWLTRDEQVFENYKNDEFCGGSFPFSFYRSLIKNMRKTNKGIKKCKGKQILLIAGSCDPVGQNGKQVKKLLKIYLKNNIDAKMKLYPNARHEILNELNKGEVYNDVLKFFEE